MRGVVLPVSEYQKILNVFKRDPVTHKLGHEYTHEAFCLLRDVPWLWTEKIDGMNVRVLLHPGLPPEFRGRTDRAHLPARLVKCLSELFPESVRSPDPLYQTVLYGEGFGVGIQGSAGSAYVPEENDFLVFDARIGDYWLPRLDVVQLGITMNVSPVPAIATGTLEEAARYVAKGFMSVVSTAPLLAEGLVLRPSVNLYLEHGQRMICKMKTRDYAGRNSG